MNEFRGVLLWCGDMKIKQTRVSASSTGRASPIQIDGRENYVTEIERLEAAKKALPAALL